MLRAINAYMRALNLKPDNPEVLTHLGVSHRFFFQNALTYSSSSNCLQWIYYEQDKLDLAIKTMRRSIEIQPNFPDSNYFIGLFYIWFNLINYYLSRFSLLQFGSGTSKERKT